tara:strand:+ start:63 stop:965 length:903 start_codon:yes stop_codon:yes gene_type:complete
MPIQQMLLGVGGSSGGQTEYTNNTHGSYTWVCPSGVTSISVVCIGAGGAGAHSNESSRDGAGGGACAYKNNITVVPGTSYSVQTGQQGINNSSPAGSPSRLDSQGGPSWFKNANGSYACFADGGSGPEENNKKGGLASNCVGDGAYSGGDGSSGSGGGYGGEGSGSNGGNGSQSGQRNTNAGNGGGAGGNGGSGSAAGGGGDGSPNGAWIGAGGGGGGSHQNHRAGGGGGGGNIGTVTGNSTTGGGNGAYIWGALGGRWGGGGSGTGGNGGNGGNGNMGAVRIIWPGDTRQFPSTEVGDV